MVASPHEKMKLFVLKSHCRKSVSVTALCFSFACIRRRPQLLKLCFLRSLALARGRKTVMRDSKRRRFDADENKKKNARNDVVCISFGVWLRINSRTKKKKEELESPKSVKIYESVCPFPALSWVSRGTAKLKNQKGK